MTIIKCKCSLLLLSIIYTCIFFSTSASSCFFTSKIRVRIVNGLPSNGVLRLNCKSKDDDLGFHYLMPEQDYEFKFCVKPYTTLFVCNLWWGYKHKGFQAYSAKMDWDFCKDSGSNKCVWVVKEEGIYTARFRPQYHLQFAYEWENYV